MPESGLTSGYSELFSSVVALLEQGRRNAARSVNTVLTSTYWLVGQRLVEHEQGGEERAAYGTELLKRLSRDLQAQLGRGFSEINLEQMRQFYLQWPNSQTLSADSSPLSISQTPSAELSSGAAPVFPLSWSHYVRLLSVTEPEARRHYEAEAIRGGWSVRQLDRQMSTLAYERSHRVSADALSSARSAESEIKDPFVLEFLGLKDEYSEADLEEALIRELDDPNWIRLSSAHSSRSSGNRQCASNLR